MFSKVEKTTAAYRRVHWAAYWEMLRPARFWKKCQWLFFRSSLIIILTRPLCGPNTSRAARRDGTSLAIQRRWPDEPMWPGLLRKFRTIYWREKSEDVSPAFVSLLAWLPVVARVVRCRPSPSERLGKPTALRKPVAHALSRTGDEFDRAAARSDACVSGGRDSSRSRESRKNQYGWPAWPRARSNIYVLGPAAAARFLRSSLAAHY